MKKILLSATNDCGATAPDLEQSKVIDYSQPGNWYKISEITKDVDTFYIYSTIYMGGNDGDGDYATLHHPEVLEVIGIEHAIKSSAFEPSTNLFIPFYRQAGMLLEADAQVCVERGTVVTHAAAVPNEMPEFAGPESYHQDDYSIYFNNVVDNVAKRIESYKNQQQ